MRRTPRFVVSLLSVPAAVMLYSQGMATSSRAPRPAAKVETDLPPIKVDFRDVAAEAGLKALTISGDKDRKKYILESTGPGVAIFDYDNDGRVDIFQVNGTRFDLQAKEAPVSHLYRNAGS